MSDERKLGSRLDGSADPRLAEVESLEGARVSSEVAVTEESLEGSEKISNVGVESDESAGKSGGGDEVRVVSEEVAETRVSELNRGNAVEQAENERRPEGDIRVTTSSSEVRVWSEEVKAEEEEDVFRSDVFSVRDVELVPVTTRAEEVSSDVFSVRDIELVPVTRRPDGGGSRVVSSGRTNGGAVVLKEPALSDFGLAYRNVGEGASSRMEAAFGSQAARAMSYGFEPGDMVWGKVKSHPWWPGHIYSEAFASTSVRRTKREGHVLVAFFGDSSYGWFDLAELVPFEPHYLEKSRQTSSRNFVKAVEEAVDETCRRRALGLTCRCRNRFNFRPTNVQGYFSVDVPGYEHGTVYSVQQIKKARDSFQPSKMLSFVQQLAAMPSSYEQRDIDWINYRATVLAYRKAAFEEFDETYAQAFGVQPVRPNPESVSALDQLSKVPSRAPLSGPLVVAEALGERKSSTRLTKVKDQTRKDKYLFKRRDEAIEPRVFHATEGPADFAVSSAYREGPTAIPPGDFVFQKRTPTILLPPVYASKQEGPGILGNAGPTLTADVCQQVTESVDSKLTAAINQGSMSTNDPQAGLGVDFPANQSVVYEQTSALQGGFEDGKLHPETGSMMYGIDERIKSDVNLRGTATGQDGSMTSEKVEAHELFNNFDHNVKILEQHKQTVSVPVENHNGPYQVLDGSHSIFTDAPQLYADAKLPGSVVGTNIVKVAKKKVLKRPAENLRPDKSSTGEMKKKKRKVLGLGTKLQHTQGHLKTGKDGEQQKAAGKSIGIGLAFRENSPVDQQVKESGGRVSALSDSGVTLPQVDLGNIVVEFPQLLSDLMGLALDPFHGDERNSPAIVRTILLRFRSLVYQKSLVLAPPGEVETSDLSISKLSASIEPSESPVGDVKLLLSKQPKHFARPDDPTKSGRKRSLSDRQEEMSVKRLKKINELKAMTAEKRSGNQRTQEVHREQKDSVEQKDQKELGTIPAGKLIVKPSFVKKQEIPAKLSEPAMLVIKFPPRTTLPSIPELKARFGRFGPLDHSAMRVFWKSSTCRVVFRHKDHAQAALNYAMQNKALFGQVRVTCYVRDVEAPASEVAEPAKPDEVVQFRPGSGSNDSVGGETGLLRRPVMQQPPIHLKSCLKKPSVDEGAGMGIPKESPRVKFMLGGEESSRGAEQLMMGSSNRDLLNKNEGGVGVGVGGATSSSLAMDVNSKNFQKVIPQVQVPLLPPNFVVPRAPRIQEMHENRGLGHFAKAPPPHHAPPFKEVVVEAINNNNNYQISPAITSSINNNIDISHQMLSLLVRCNDIVMDVKSSLGYVPYHPL